MNKKQETAIKKTFGLNIRLLRYQADLSQEQLAERANIHPTYLSSIEKGERSIGLIKIMKLAKALGVSPRDLMPE